MSTNKEDLEKKEVITSENTGNESVEKVIKELEERGIAKAIEVLPKILENSDSKSENPGDELVKFMTTGTEEFKARTGRPMTYAEMRAAWG